ncbi:MAG: 4Fe-4S dicluster domain-containing protein [Thermoleophilia bacterium]|nr:4Fe-4S dicluster domain-containing protein [Thermoleophilia bacterium]
MAKPSAFPPSVAPDEFVMVPEAPEDERLNVGALFVGGGAAGMAGAIHLAKLINGDAELLERLGDVPIAIVDKGATVGAHQLSGAVVNPGPLQELFPDQDLATIDGYVCPVEKEAVYLMTKRSAIKLPTPPPFRNHGNHIFELSRLTRWLGEQAEALGVMVIPETTADRLLIEGDVVRGVRTGDKGRGREGEELGNFEPGSELHAQVTVLSEGTQGHLSLAAIEHFGLESDPQVWALGVKELWKVPKKLDKVIHSLGWPLRTGAKYREFGGSFIYPMSDNHLCIGFVTSLDTGDAEFSVHDVLQEYKTHPMIRKLLEGGERVAWGAKTIPEGGHWSIPNELAIPGAMLTGDSAGFVNVPKLKGVHLAMRSGMLAATQIYIRLKAQTLAGQALTGYDSAVRKSEIGADLYRSRNMKQPFRKGFFIGGAVVNLMEATAGRFPGKKWENHADADQNVFLGGRSKSYPQPDGKLTFDKLSSVFLSGNKTRDDQPDHIRVEKQLPRSVAVGYVSMCPAAVYELPEGVSAEGDPDEMITMHVNPSNCVHCGAITSKGGRLTPPEGGSGPEYTRM